ncbi:MAG: hypothetical protein C3F11_14085 [Methylocystaceae bacterium]|nr:MAG: hypothetical protein C3F11_14085 [Methylocystaceae bacterium]
MFRISCPVPRFEPIAGLDPETALGVLRVSRNIAHERKIATLCSLIKPNSRRRWLRDGRLALDKSTSNLSAGDTRYIYVRAARRGLARR